MTKWTTTKLVAIAGLSGVYLVVSLFGSVPQMALGMGANMIILVPLGNMIIIFTVLLIKKFGTASILALIHAIAVLPLATMGPPGFLPKIPAAFLGGLAVDIAFFLLRKKPKLASMVAPGVGEVSLSFGLLGLFLLWGMSLPEWSKEIFTSPLFILLGVIGIVALAGFGGYLGWLAYNKLKNTAVVKRIQT